MSSFIETTLPPGYVMCSGLFAGAAEIWHLYMDMSEIGLPMRRSSALFRTEAECRRSAWRHWTATVLRGRDVGWDDDLRRASRLGAATVVTGGRWYSVCAEGDEESDNYHVVPLCSTDDPDEAMARFAALVLATEGMVTR
jgi:hypothetical protein